MKCNWIVAHEKLESDPAEPKLTDAVKRAGHNLYLSYYKDFMYTKHICPLIEPTILQGPINFIKQYKSIGYNPGAYGFTDDMNVSNYISKSNLKGSFLNNGVFATISQVRNQFKFFIDMNGGEFFIRPNSGFKTFQGFIVSDIKEFELDVRTQNISNETLCLITTVKEIDFEFRFVICDGEVIAGSQYSWNGKKDVRIDILPEAQGLAEMVAKDSWQPDSVYTVDVAILKGRNWIPKIIEFNSFASSGLYQCNRDIIVECVSRVAMKEW